MSPSSNARVEPLPELPISMRALAGTHRARRVVFARAREQTGASGLTARPVGRNSTMAAKKFGLMGAMWARKAFARAIVLVAMAALSFGCASYRGTARGAQPSVVAQQGQWTMVPNFPLVTQTDDYVFFGTMKDIVHELEQGRPVIVGLGKMFDEKQAISHHEVVVGYEAKTKQLLLLDPARGWQVDSLEGFAKEWAISRAVTIVAFPDTGAVSPSGVAARNVPNVATVSPTTTFGSLTESQSYAAREAASPDAFILI